MAASAQAPPRPRRGEVWIVDLDPTLGHEQAGRRPGLVISVDGFNQSAAELAIVLPVTSRKKSVRSHVLAQAGEAGLKVASFIKCEDVRSISTRRLHRRLGSASPATLRAVEERLRILMGL